MKYFAAYSEFNVLDTTEPLNVTSVPFHAPFSIKVFASMILLPLPLPSDQKGSLAL